MIFFLASEWPKPLRNSEMRVENNEKRIIFEKNRKKYLIFFVNKIESYNFASRNDWDMV